ncbi:iron-siderophore ABC transporter substrate-binding protein [Planctomonas sp. JC2975]|uniref:iron-siderophore ABC transporter substrate-binding protein n=1 Tax=Planctomonas sp. JC2975 TaxID=2729626 RepID=UPI001473A565|nr:iron-siderophore ABC transporter substrate-binding protein [Planctomonas sp. JC2975]NNC13100.1 iron-siderophore ABC transporter substrate-binding protein [Planctomonas sp. JC2975]
MITRAHSASPARFRRGRLAAVAVLAATALALTGCSSTAGTSTNDAESAGGAFPVSLKNTFGTTVIQSAPKRVSTISWTNQDAAIALGDIPVSMSKATYGDDNGDGVLPWTAAALKKADAKTPQLNDETDGIPYEKIADSTPDVILGAYSGLTKQEYSTLSKIAPTVSYPKAAWGTPWRVTTLTDGEALGKKAQAQKLIADTEKTISTEIAKYPQIKGKTVMYIWVDPKDLSTITYYTPSDARVKFLGDLGLKNAPSIEKLAAGSSQFFGTISSEKADTLDADIAVLYVDDAGSYDLIKKDPLLSQIPAVKRGSVVVLDDTTEIMASSAPSVLSIPWVLPTYVPQLAKAADKVG